MKLINNRYKVKELILTDEYEEGFLVMDLSNYNKKCMLRLYDLEKNKNVIKYYIENFMEISQIKHKNLLGSYSFNLVESLNLKKSNVPMYYSILEYLERPIFRSFELSLNLAEMLKIILDLMSVIDFLHFRGYIYQYLNPSNIFYSRDKSVIILDLSTISEYKINSYYDDTVEGFLAPETFMDNNFDNKADLYSLGMMMKYLLLEDHLKDKVDFIYKAGLNLKPEGVEFLTNIITNLTEKLPTSRNITLRTHIDSIVQFFQLNYSYDLTKERGHFYSKTKIVGRDAELEKLLPNNLKHSREEESYDLAIISGNEGDGKTKLLEELSYRLKMKGRNVYLIDVKENNINNISNISSLIKETLKNTSSEIINKYSDDFSSLLSDAPNIKEHTSLNLEVEKFKVMNRLGNYFKEISKNNKCFFIIDNFHKIKDDFISFLDYIIANTDSTEISFIIGYETRSNVDDKEVLNALNKWKLSNNVLDLKLEKLTEEDIGILTKSILGISYIPKRFSSILYKGSQGNPLYLDYIIKYLFNKGELYINKGGKWGLKTEDYSTLPIPSNINKAIEEQLNKIKTEDLVVLKAISVFTDKFTKPLLIKILGLNIKTIDMSLKNLIVERFIEPHVDSTYSIVTNGWQRILYSRMSVEEKSNLQGKIANVLIEEYKENTHLYFEEIVNHLVKSNNIRNTLEFISKEWDKLDNKYGDESIYLCEEAYKLIKDDDGENKLFYLDRLVDINFIKGDIEKSNKYLKELIVETNIQKNIDFQIKAMVHEISECLMENNLERSYELAEEIEKISRVNNKPIGIIESLIIKCKIVIGNKELAYIENLLEEAKRLSEIENNEKYLGTIYNLLGMANHLEGNTEISVYNYKNSIEHSINSNNMLEATKPMNNLGEIYSVNHGNIDMALYYYNRGLEIANMYGFTSSAIIFLNNLGELYKNTADMNKALNLFEESLKGAIKIGDYKMVFLANANLGSLYISYNMIEKAQNCYTFLNSEYANNPIVEVEIIIQYYMFLGEYYECFGELELAIDYFQKVIELCKGHNNRDSLRGRVKIILINFSRSLVYDKTEVKSLINDLKDAKLVYDRQKFLLYLSIMLYIIKENEFANELLGLYDIDNNFKRDSALLNLRICLGFLIEDSEEALSKIEELIENNQNLKYNNANLYIYNILGKAYFEKESYCKSAKNFLKSLEQIYKSEKEIPQACIYDKFVKVRQGNIIKKYITECLDKIVDKDFKYKLETSLDLSNLINSLPNEIFNKIFYNHNEDLNMGSIEEFISNLTEDYDDNIDFILKYIGLNTLADRGHILQYDENTNEYISISSLVKGDTKLPNESVLIQCNKSKLGLLLNKNMEYMDKSKYYDYLNSSSVAIICVPINIAQKTQEVIKDRRKRIFSSSQYNKGYIYLESYGSLNRFDFERLKIINSLSYLIYLNIENNNLKLISSVDKLTAVYTRKYFEQKFIEILKKINRSNQSITILMLDIDNFKSVNDTYGHLKGDEVLSEVAKTIKNSIRSTDLVGRYGGEEFIVLLSDSTINLGRNIAEKIRTNIAKMCIADIDRTITISIGLAQYPNHSQFREELINKADQALYYAKNFMGKNSSAIWNVDMGNSYNRIDKLAGVLTGNTGLDNRNLLTILDMVDLGIESTTFKEKAHLFLGRTLDSIDGEYATLFLLEDDQTPIPYGSRIRLNSEWIKTPVINMEMIKDVIKKTEGEYLIDWDMIENICPITGVPSWESIMIIPIINMDLIKGLLYITVPLEEREFDFNSFNLTKLLCKIFASNL